MAMNIFRHCGDFIHVFAVLMILHRLLIVKNAQGVSRKTQELVLVVFCTRYIDLFTTFYSLYNTVMKVFYICTSAHVVFVLSPISRHSALGTYRTEQDDFEHWKWLAAPCFALGSLVHYVGSGPGGFDLTELLWTFSIALESVALLPQIYMFRRYRQVESLTGGSYILLFGLYRLFYIFNWIYRANYERLYKHHWFVYICGVVHAGLSLGGFFWPSAEAEESSAPLMPQLIQFYKEVVSDRFFVTALASFFVVALISYLGNDVVHHFLDFFGYGVLGFLLLLALLFGGYLVLAVKNLMGERAMGDRTVDDDQEAPDAEEQEGEASVSLSNVEGYLTSEDNTQIAEEAQNVSDNSDRPSDDPLREPLLNSNKPSSEDSGAEREHEPGV